MDLHIWRCDCAAAFRRSIKLLQPAFSRHVAPAHCAALTSGAPYTSWHAFLVHVWLSCARPSPCRRKLAAYAELQQRLERKEKLARTAAHLSLEKELAGKGRKRKLSKREVAALQAAHGLQGEQDDDNGYDEDGGKRHEGAVYKWKRERKK